MGVDLLRGGGGRSHFLVASLALLSLFLLFNWWSLSTDNLDLLKQIEGLTQHLKSSSNALDQCRNDRGTLESRVKRCEDNAEKLAQKVELDHKQIGQLENSLKDSNNEVATASKKFHDANFSLKNCQTELDSLKTVDKSKDSMIASMRIEKNDLSKQIQELSDQVTNLKSEINQLKLEQNSQKKATSSTVAQKGENDNENEVRGIPAPNHAEQDKETEHKGDHIAEKDDPVDERELEMQGNGEEKKV